jgi:hypothetical protein
MRLKALRPELAWADSFWLQEEGEGNVPPLVFAGQPLCGRYMPGVRSGRAGV